MRDSPEPIRRLMWLTCTALLLTCAASTVRAAEAMPTRNQVFVSGVGALIRSSEFDDTDLGYGGGVGWAISDRWAIEGLYLRAEPESGTFSTRAESGWLNLLYMLREDGGAFKPYLTLGAGRTDYSSTPPELEEFEREYNAGIGFFRHMGGRMSFRGDLRAVYSYDSKKLEPFAMLGLTLSLGPTKSEAAPVMLAAAASVDSDGDGVDDGPDRCPNTAANATVDADGCELDDDRDGVVNSKDQCPDTEAGARVDEHGCYVMLEETVTFDLYLEFPSNAAEIQPTHADQIRQVAAFLREYPQTRAEIEGHTDNTGTAEYNQLLSEQRAQAVADELVSLGVSEARLASRGYGEERPIADNDTREGRSQNRRVTAVISATREVRQMQ